MECSRIDFNYTSTISLEQAPNDIIVNMLDYIENRILHIEISKP